MPDTDPLPRLVLVVEDEVPVLRFLRTTLGCPRLLHRRGRHRSAGPRRRRDPNTRPHPPRPGPARHRWSRSHATHPRVVGDAHHRPFGPRSGARQDRGSGRGRRRLSHQALQRRGAARPHARRAAERGTTLVRRHRSLSSTFRGFAWISPPEGCSWTSDEVHLTRTEFNLLATLVRYAGRVVTHRQLLREVWGPGSTGQVALRARLHGPAPAQAGSGPGATALPRDRDRRRLPSAVRVARNTLSLPETVGDPWPRKGAGLLGARQAVVGFSGGYRESHVHRLPMGLPGHAVEATRQLLPDSHGAVLS